MFHIILLHFEDMIIDYPINKIILNPKPNFLLLISLCFICVVH
jgi:hypothetical protein